MLLAAFQDDLLDIEARHRQVHRPDGHEAPRPLAVEAGEALGLLRAVGPQDQVEEGRFLHFKLLSLFLLAQVRVHADVVLALVLAQVENFEGAVVLALGLEGALHPDQPLARRVDGELPQVRDDPLAPQLLRHRRRRPRASEEVGDQVAFVGRSFDNAFEEGFGFLGWVVHILLTARSEP